MYIFYGMMDAVVITAMSWISYCARMFKRVIAFAQFGYTAQVKWRKVGPSNFILKLRDPLEVTALLALALSKMSGPISNYEREMLAVLFRSEFDLTEGQANELLLISDFLFDNCDDPIRKPELLMQQSLNNFTFSEARAAIELLELVITINVSNVVEKRYFVAKVSTVFEQKFKIKGKW